MRNSYEYKRIWIRENGPIPVDEEGRSYEIHHIDGNRSNNDLTNLACLSIKDHWELHFNQGDYDAANLIATRMHKVPLKGYTGHRRGAKLSQEHKNALIQSRVGYKASEETKRKMSNSLKGKQKSPFSEEHRKKLSESTKGRKKAPFSEEHRRNMSEAKKGLKQTIETINKRQQTRKHNFLLKKGLLVQNNPIYNGPI